MFSTADRQILRDVAKQVKEVANLPIQEERRKLWKKHNSLQPCRPLMLVFPEGSSGELLTDSALRCENRDARQIEWYLRFRLYHQEHFRADTVIEGDWVVSKVVHDSGWGINMQTDKAPDGSRGAWHFHPVLKTPEDLKKLRFPELTYDEAASMKAFADAQELFGDILDVVLHGRAHVSYHLMNQFTGWHGLEETMMDMYDNPGFLHEAMAILVEGHQRCLKQLLAQNLLEANNNGSYHNSGGVGYTDEIPKPGYDPKHIKPSDMWASAEAQELTLVSRQMHKEFVLDYEAKLLAPFALQGYGCCDDLGPKLDDVLAIPGMRRISIAPVANVDLCAQKLANRRAIFSWKPQPSHLVGTFNEALVRRYVRHTLDVCRANNCALEIILKDTHTCENHPERFDQWTQVAREEIERSVAA